MPKQTTTKRLSQRQAPYQERNTITVPPLENTMGTLISPLPNTQWEQNHIGMWNCQPVQQYATYPQPSYEYNPYHRGLPTPLSAPPNLQPVQAPVTPALPTQRQTGGNITTQTWTKEMDDILVEYHKRLKWDEIADRFFQGTGKTGNACRKRYARVVVERREPSRWEPERVRKIILAYTPEVRQRMWSILADATGESWQDVERLSFSQGLRTMIDKYPREHARQVSRSTSSSHQSRHRSRNSMNSEGTLPQSEYQECENVNLNESNESSFQSNSGLHHQRQPIPALTLDLYPPHTTSEYQDAQNVYHSHTEPYYT